MADLDTIIANAGAGWNFFDGVSDEVKRRTELAQAKSEEERRVIAGAWAHFAATPDGARALQLLFDSTLNRTVFFVNLGQNAEAMAMWGCFREGQNALAHEIARQVAIGRAEEELPKPREQA